MTNTLHQSADASYCYQCRDGKYCKEPRLDGQKGRELRDTETDKWVANVSTTIKQCIANKKK